MRGRREVAFCILVFPSLYLLHKRYFGLSCSIFAFLISFIAHIHIRLPLIHHHTNHSLLPLPSTLYTPPQALSSHFIPTVLSSSHCQKSTVTLATHTHNAPTRKASSPNAAFHLKRMIIIERKKTISNSPINFFLFSVLLGQARQDLKTPPHPLTLRTAPQVQKMFSFHQRRTCGKLSLMV